MYFFKNQGKQFLDLTGNLILSHNDRLVKARTPSAGPYKILNSKFVVNAGDLNLRGKFKATILALRFIWGKPQPLLAEDTNLKTPTRNNDIVATTSSRDWSEDFENENGNYQNKCPQCKRFFMGNKHRITCKVCSNDKRS